MSETPQLLLAHHLKALRLPTFLREYDKLARQCAVDGVDHVRYLVRLSELELIDREHRMVERRIRQAKFPAVKSLDSFDFRAIPSLNKMLVLELARCEYVERRENIIALGNSGTGKTHVALGLGLAACQKGLTVGFITAAALVHELMEARDEKRLLRLQMQLAKYKLLIIDELGFVPLSKTGAELLFEVFSQRYERGSTLLTSNLPFDEWTGAPDRGLIGPAYAPCPYPGDERRQLPAQSKPKTAEIPKKHLTGLNHRGHGCPGGSTGTSRAPCCVSVWGRTPQAARVPPMDYRDNPQHRVGHTIKCLDQRPRRPL
jgi:DNA replication protein DnaC